jgi:PAS domain S-box-containing protein
MGRLFFLVALAIAPVVLVALATICDAGWRGAAAVGAAVGLAALVTWFVGRHFVRRPLAVLLDTALAWQQGDWRARAPDAGTGGEIGALAAAFNTMAARLAQRERALRDSEALLRDSERHLARAQQLGAVGSFEIDPRGELVWSQETYRIFGVTPGQFRPAVETVVALFHPEDRSTLRAALRRSAAGETIRDLTLRIVRPDGALRTVKREATPLCDATGAVTGVLGTIRDITEQQAVEDERRRLEALLDRSSRLETLGCFAGGVAHELNNMIQPILIYSGLSLEDVPPDGELHGNLVAIREAALAARDLLKRVVAFSRIGARGEQIVDLGAIVGDALASSASHGRIRVRRAIGAVPAVIGDPEQLKEAIAQLIDNAVRAIGEESGTITVSLAAGGGRSWPGKPASASPDESILLSIHDTGCGIDEAAAPYLFDPFFTTREVGQGSGLGLALVHGVITGHGGTVEVASAATRGTQFDIYFPVREFEARPG